MAYVGVLGLLAMAGLHFWDELPDAAPPEPAAEAGWSLASSSYPAFAVRPLNLFDKTETYEMFRHLEGGVRTFCTGWLQEQLQEQLKHRLWEQLKDRLWERLKDRTSKIPGCAAPSDRRARQQAGPRCSLLCDLVAITALLRLL
jgi:hypothetical protein